MSWIDEEERLLEIQDHCDREEMESIKCYFIYVNLNGYIQSITTDNIELTYNREKNISLIPKNKLLNIIQKQKIDFKNSKYIYKDACSFIVNLDPEDIKEFSTSLNLTSYIIISLPKKFHSWMMLLLIHQYLYFMISTVYTFFLKK